MTEHVQPRGGAPAPSRSAPDSKAGTMRDEVRAIIAAVFGIAPERIVGAASLVDDLGATSLDFVEMVMAVEEAFDIEISDDAAAKVRTVDDLEALIARRRSIEHRPLAS